ncbi:MAG: GNAT family N-acetyltransferase [Granulosicoccus sp.]
MIIRRETVEDIEAIFRLTTEAFSPVSFSDGSEPQIIDALRSDGELTLSLVAVDHSHIVGHIAFSPVRINGVDDSWFGLGPLSVLPELQKKGIGTLLINEGCRQLEERGANGIVLIGNPDYYGKFGFTGGGKISYRDVPVRLVQWLSFKSDMPEGEIQYCRGFK